MRKLLALLLAATLFGCAASGGGSDGQSETTVQVTSTTRAVTTTKPAPTTTTSTMPRLQAVEEMGAEIDRACAEAVDGLDDPDVRYDSSWAPYGSRAELVEKAKECVAAKWAAVEEAQRKAEEEQRRVEEQRRAEEEAALGTVSQQNARQKAADYLDYSAFSRTGLIEQLEYEGFSSGDAAFGVDALNVDWNEQAAKKAADYLDYSSFSRSGLIDQLLYEGFTQAQAEYGVSTTGL